MAGAAVLFPSTVCVSAETAFIIMKDCCLRDIPIMNAISIRYIAPNGVPSGWYLPIPASFIIPPTIIRPSPGYTDKPIKKRSDPDGTSLRHLWWRRKNAKGSCRPNGHFSIVHITARKKDNFSPSKRIFQNGIK